MTRIFKPEELTDWYPPGTPPVHPGFYLVKFRSTGGLEFIRLWDGKLWRAGGWAAGERTPARRAGANWPIAVPKCYWRGVRKECCK